jgi:stage V sporulation protein AD
MDKRIGKRTVSLQQKVYIESAASIVGPKEGEGPWGKLFDQVIDDDLWGEKSWEKAETKLFYESVRIAMDKAGCGPEEVDFLLGGDLLNQLIATSFAARRIDIPFIGLYGACSTIAESTALGAMLVDGGFARRVACCATSHFSTAERQFRFPLEMGAQRTPTAQRTVTGAGAVVLDTKAHGRPYISSITIGKVVDFGIKDVNNMGAAMAPAACDTILAHLADTGRKPSDYSAIITGDLGSFGLSVLIDLMQKAGVDTAKRFRDCGAEIYALDQDTHAGGSGCACCAVTLCSRLLPDLIEGRLSRILVVATGALLSTLSTQQGESIPSVAHAICIERGE